MGAPRRLSGRRVSSRPASSPGFSSRFFCPPVMRSGGGPGRRPCRRQSPPPSGTGLPAGCLPVRRPPDSRRAGPAGRRDPGAVSRARCFTWSGGQGTRRPARSSGWAAREDIPGERQGCSRETGSQRKDNARRQIREIQMMPRHCYCLAIRFIVRPCYPISPPHLAVPPCRSPARRGGIGTDSCRLTTRRPARLSGARMTKRAQSPARLPLPGQPGHPQRFAL